MEAATGQVTRLFMPLLGAPRIASVRRILRFGSNEPRFTVFPSSRLREQ